MLTDMDGYKIALDGGDVYDAYRASFVAERNREREEIEDREWFRNVVPHRHNDGPTQLLLTNMMEGRMPGDNQNVNKVEPDEN